MARDSGAGDFFGGETRRSRAGGREKGSPDTVPEGDVGWVTAMAFFFFFLSATFFLILLKHLSIINALVTGENPLLVVYVLKHRCGCERCVSSHLALPQFCGL